MYKTEIRAKTKMMKAKPWHSEKDEGKTTEAKYYINLKHLVAVGSDSGSKLEFLSMIEQATAVLINL